MQKKWGLLAAVLVTGLPAAASPAVAESATAAGDAQLVRLPETPRALDILQSIPLFAGAAPAPWTSNSSSNVTVSLGAAKTDYPVLRMESRQKDLLAKDRKANWFTFNRPLKADATWAQAEGLRLVLAAAPARSWPLALYLNTRSGASFRHYPITPGGYAPEFQDRLLPFRTFKSGNGTESLDPTQITSLTFESAPLAGTLYLAEISLYRPKSQADGWLTFTSRSTPTQKNGDPERFCNIHEPGVPVSLEFAQAAPPPAGITGFEVEIRDYDGAIVARRPVALVPGQTVHRIEFQSPGAGYYEVRAYGTGPADRREALSCLKTSGSMPAGLGTFAVVPATLGENLAAMQTSGQNSFFGFHERTDPFGLMPLMRLPWRLPYSRWSGYEKAARPDRAGGVTAAWAQELIAKTPPAAAWQPGIVAFSPNIDVPAWAKIPGDTGPGFQWDDYLAFLRDYVRVCTKIYPNQRPRIYEGSWEIFLNSPEHPSRKPLYDAAMVTELYRRSAAVIKAEDPEAWLIGPCDGYLHPACQDFFNNLFKAGFLEHVDAVSTHSYAEPPPEQSDIPNNLALLREQIRKYKGRDLPIINTEAGFESRVGSVDHLRDHARWEVRYAMIMKGEGVRQHLAFYQFDFGIGGNRMETWGFCFNLDPKVTFGPREIAPKPAVPAYAVCAKMLGTAQPVQNLRWWGKDVWGYVFEDRGEPLLAVWNPNRRQSFRVPVGEAARVTVTSIMGRERVVPAKDGFATVEIGPDPVYIIGAAKEVYLTDSLPATLVYPGQSRGLELKLPGTLQNVTGWGGVTAAAATGGILVTVPKELPPSPVPLRLLCRDAQGNRKTVIKWLTVDPAVELVNVQPVQRGGMLGAGVTLANHAAGQPAPVRVLLRTEKSGDTIEAKAVLEGGETRELFLPVEVAKQAAATDAMSVDVRVEAGTDTVLERQERFFFLCALRNPDVPDPVFSNRVQLKGPGASGQPDQADLQFTWNEQELTITLVARDDVFQQGKTDATTWMEDSVQLAFDTDPASEYLYDPYAGRLSKKVTEICVAHTPRGNRVWRHTTHSRNELAVGDVTGQGIRFDWNRDEPGKTTTYVLHIPWAQLGLNTVRPGQSIGLALLVNDADGGAAKRRCLPLFDGIANAKNFRLYGRLVLK
ncbi:MAG: sugar-binding protein [Lentisphaeria bacterium]